MHTTLLILIAAGEEHLRPLGAKRIIALVSRSDDRATQTWLSTGYENEIGSARLVKPSGQPGVRQDEDC